MLHFTARLGYHARPMAKPIIVTRDAHASQFQLKRIDRSKLYGKRRRIPLDPAGMPCARAAITEDGVVSRARTPAPKLDAE